MSNNIFKISSVKTPTKDVIGIPEQNAALEKLREKLRVTQQEHEKLADELRSDGDEEFDIKKYEKETKSHIQQLKQYNELKDLSMKLIQMIADSRQETLRAIMDEMGVEDDK